MIYWFSYLTWRMLRMLLSPGLLVMWCGVTKAPGLPSAAPRCKCRPHPAGILCSVPGTLPCSFPHPRLLFPSCFPASSRAGRGSSRASSRACGELEPPLRGKEQRLSWQVSAAGQPSPLGWPCPCSGLWHPWEMTGWVVLDVPKSH